MKKIICFIIVFTFIFAFIPAVKVDAEDMRWKQYLKEFLITDFPSIYDEETIKKNNEIFLKIGESYRTDSEYSMKQAVEENIDEFSDDIQLWGYRFMLPLVYGFYDLDNDGIPEVIIWYGAEGIGCENGSGWTEIYKLYGTSYEKINTMDYTGDEYYVNPQNEIAVYNYWGISGNLEEWYNIRILEISNREVTYNDYNISAEEFFDECTPLSKFDISDVLDSIKYDIPLEIPKTGDISIIFYVIFIANMMLFIFITVKNKRGKHEF